MKSNTGIKTLNILREENYEKTFFYLLTVCWFTCITNSLFAITPMGFNYDNKTGIKISAEIAKVINIQTRSFDHESYIKSYMVLRTK